MYNKWMLKKKRKNKFEEKLFKQLTRCKCAFKYESEKIPYVYSGHYVPDFCIVLSDGNKLYIEAKGYLRPEHRRKMVAVKRTHPAMDIRFVFYSHRPTYIKWAEKCGFPWAIGKIPKEWLI